MNRFFLLIGLCFVFSLMGIQMGYAQKIEESDTRGMIQANFLYQFASNNNWPESVRKGKFMIGIIGNSSVYEQMSEKYGAKPIGVQTMEIVALTVVPEDQFFHILFIDKSKRNELIKATRELRKKNTLIVTNWEGAIETGAQINFKTVDGNIRYQLNDETMIEKKISPGVKILQWKVE